MCARVLALFAIGVVSINAAPVVSSKKAFLAPQAHDALVGFLGDVSSATTSFENWNKALKVAKPTMTEEQFSKQCVAHTKWLVASLDFADTDAQLQYALEQDCKLIKSVPVAQGTMFDSDESCLDAAKDLVELRNNELKTKDEEHYSDFCEDLFADSETDAEETYNDENKDADKDDSKDDSKDADKDDGKDDDKDDSKDDSKDADEDDGKDDDKDDSKDASKDDAKDGDKDGDKDGK